MIQPTTLYNFGKVCKDSVVAGNVLRALCRQPVPLSPAEQTVFDMIQNDSGWMDERIEERREKDKKRQKEWRESHAASRRVTVTPCDFALSRPLPSSLPSSLQEDTIRSVPVTRTPAHARGNATNANANGTVDLKSLRDRVAKFEDDLRADSTQGGGAFFDPAHDPAVVCVAVTGDFKSIVRWRQLARAKGEGAVREECFAFWRELAAGERPANPGAALNARLARLEDEK